MRIKKLILLPACFLLAAGCFAVANAYHSKLTSAGKLVWIGYGSSCTRGSQERLPTKAEKEAGITALKAWKTSSDFQKFQLSDDLVLGKTLIGMSNEEVARCLGKPVSLNPSETYYFTNPRYFASQWDLHLIFKNNKCIDAYIVSNL